ncbi:MAG: hypothetical protein WC644_01545 [Ignavibacteria bacterium]
METKLILKQIGKLPFEDKMLIIEKTLKFIREKEVKERITKAVSEMINEYKSNKELTAFTEIDFENFYEAR